MEIIVSSLAVIVAAGCFLAIAASDMKEHRSKKERVAKNAVAKDRREKS